MTLTCESQRPSQPVGTISQLSHHIFRVKTPLQIVRVSLSVCLHMLFFSIFQIYIKVFELKLSSDNLKKVHGILHLPDLFTPTPNLIFIQPDE